MRTGSSPVRSCCRPLPMAHPHMRCAAFFGLILLVLSSGVAWATDLSTTESVLRGERPSLNGEPTVIEIGVFVVDIDKIDDVNQRFRVDLFFMVRWHDPRLALPEAERKGQKRFMRYDEIWTPSATVLNERGLTPQLREGVEVDDLGNVVLQNRLMGELAADLQFHEFPFDEQRLPIDIISYEYTEDALQFSPDSEIISQADQFSIEGWQLVQLPSELGVYVPFTDGERYPRLTFVFEARRNSDYYLFTMLVPMSLIIFMAWTVFWLQPNIVPPRISIATASIFSLIALGVSIRLGLPKISYLTRADIFVLGCTLMVFLALGVAVIGSRWANSERMEKALKTNAIARWVYMILFFLIAFASFYH